MGSLDSNRLSYIYRSKGRVPACVLQQHGHRRGKRRAVHLNAVRMEDGAYGGDNHRDQ